MNLLLIFLFLVFALLILIIAVVNITPHVNVNLLYREFTDVPLGLVMLGCLAAGVIVASVMGFTEVLRLRFRNRQLRKKVRSLEATATSSQDAVPDDSPRESPSEEVLQETDPSGSRKLPP